MGWNATGGSRVDGAGRSNARLGPAALHGHVAQLLRFVLIGMGAVVVDFVVYFALSRALPSLPLSVDKAASFVSGACLSFVGNRGFVFRAKERTHRQWMSFVGLYFVSLCLNNVVNGGVLQLPVPDRKLVAWFCATGASTILNFLGMKLFVFKRAATTTSS